MPSVKPVEETDLNGISLSPKDLVTDELVGYVSYVKNLCSDLGTAKDSPEGQQDWLNFKKEIDSARISTFTPDAIDDVHSFDDMDLTGENCVIDPIPMTMFAMFAGAPVWCFAQNGGLGLSPFDIKKGEQYVDPGEGGVSPFDLDYGEYEAAPKGQIGELELTA